MNSSIADQLQKIQRHIAELAEKAGRTPDEIKLIAVSKTHPAERIQEAWESGQRCFGENRVQEALGKMEQLKGRTDIEWHLIGPLQKNKARFCPGKFHWIHSVDSIPLAETLEKKCAESGQLLRCLAQVNLSQEDSKHGVLTWDELCHVGEYLASCRWLVWKGLMTMAHPEGTESQTRALFATLFQWQERLKQKFDNVQLTELSMGMTSDYPWAIEEGATLIRVGRAIFGDRG